jgi:cytoplasmic iron level regulating protein YaaA (DUF328/UPF0246 family)
MKIALISCVKTKQSKPCKASEMYISSWFKSAYRYAIEQKPDKIFILSAKYGLLDQDEIIETYEQKMSTRTSEKRAWSENVIKKLSEKCDLQQDEFIILAGEAYRSYLIPHIKNYTIPLKKLSIGQQLSFFKKHFSGR